MWHTDGPDMLYCDGHRVWRVKPVYDPNMPFRIELVEILSIDRAVPEVWPTKYE